MFVFSLKISIEGENFMGLVNLQNVKKEYVLGETRVCALENISLTIAEGEFATIWGPSGSGKSSLLNLIGGLDVPTQGTVQVAGIELGKLNDKDLAKFRNQYIGFVFQSFNLVPVLSACENVMLPAQIGGAATKQAREAAMRRLEEVGLGAHALKRPDQLSGGQRQRVAIARALIKSPSLVIADEPTANLDSETGLLIINLMRELNRTESVTFIFSSHDPRLLDRADRRILLQDGRICTEAIAV